MIRNSTFHYYSAVIALLLSFVFLLSLLDLRRNTLLICLLSSFFLALCVKVETRKQEKRNHFDREICYMSWSSISHSLRQPSIESVKQSVNPLPCSAHSNRNPINYDKSLRMPAFGCVDDYLADCRRNDKLLLCRRTNLSTSPNSSLSSYCSSTLFPLFSMIFHIFPELISYTSSPRNVHVVFLIYFSHLDFTMYYLPEKRSTTKALSLPALSRLSWWQTNSILRLYFFVFVFLSLSLLLLEQVFMCK